MINHIKERGHVVGFHPSLETFDNAEKWKLEKDSLEQTLNAQVNEGRQHYLRFKAPFTWQIWEDNNMLFDSTVGFNKLVGFRCGTGDSFSIFNFLTRKKLNLKELPLVVMEGALKSMTKTSNDYLAALNKYRDISRCYNMKYTVLFHNSSFDPVFWKGWKDVYLNFCGVDNG